jgi:hypothetical protein
MTSFVPQANIIKKPSGLIKRRMVDDPVLNQDDEFI